MLHVLSHPILCCWVSLILNCPFRRRVKPRFDLLFAYHDPGRTKSSWVADQKDPKGVEFLVKSYCTTLCDRSDLGEPSFEVTVSLPRSRRGWQMTSQRSKKSRRFGSALQRYNDKTCLNIFWTWRCWNLLKLKRSNIRCPRCGFHTLLFASCHGHVMALAAAARSQWLCSPACGYIDRRCICNRDFLDANKLKVSKKIRKSTSMWDFFWPDVIREAFWS